MKIIKTEEFASVIQSGLVLVDFYADWCGPCKMLGPVLEQIQQEQPEITIVKVNVDEEEALAMQFQVMSIPLVIVFKDGKQVDQMLGYHSKDQVEEMIGRHK